MEGIVQRLTYFVPSLNISLVGFIMKKQDIIDLIDAHLKNNDAAFVNKVYDIAREFSDSGDKDIAEYLVAQVTPSLRMTAQEAETTSLDSSFFRKIPSSREEFLLPDVLSDQLKGLVNAVNKNIGINKFLFTGLPGTGKTEAAKQLARVLHRDLYVVNFDTLVDSKLGMTAKNIVALFTEINSYVMPKKALFLFDEIDTIALDRINKNDIREMGRATSTLLRCLDDLNSNVLLIATTNLQKQLDSALKRRFDAIIDFDQYSFDDLLNVASSYIDSLSKQNLEIEKNTRLLRKIIAYSGEALTPGRIKNMLRTSVAFSDGVGKDYLRRFYLLCKKESKSDLDELISLRSAGFSLRDMQTLTLKSKSDIFRILQQENIEQ